MAGITEAELDELARGELPWAVDMGLRVERLGGGACRVRLPFDPSYVRPGGTVAGPMMIAAASFAMYAAVLSAYGPVKQTVARQLSCTFLRAAAPADLLADARLLHRGARAAYGEAALYSAADEAAGPVAHVTMTFSIPASTPASTPAGSISAGAPPGPGA